MTKNIVTNETPVTDLSIEEVAANKQQKIKNTLKLAAAVVGIVLIGIVAIGIHSNIDTEMNADSNE